MSVSLATPTQVRLYNDCWSQTVPLLARLGIQQCEVPETWRTRLSDDGRTHLRADGWKVIQEGVSLAEARMVYIVGRNAEILNCILFSENPAVVPGLMIEIVALGNRPRLAFLDCPSPGMGQSQKSKVAQSWQGICGRYALLPRREEVPSWAVRYSPGNYLFTRLIKETLSAGLLRSAYFDYLTRWVQFTSQQAATPREILPQASQEIEDYKQEHLEHSPGIPFLEKFFGTNWTHEFMHDFLYR